MTINLVKFFQGIQVRTDNNYNTLAFVTNKDHDIVLDGQFVKINAKGCTKYHTLTTFQNVQYVEVENDRPKEKGSAGAGKASKNENRLEE